VSVVPRTSRQTRPKDVPSVDITVKAAAKLASSNLHAWTFIVDLCGVAVLSIGSLSQRGIHMQLRHWR
jgi:hypothetical protein